jgi:hypothetical protein
MLLRWRGLQQHSKADHQSTEAGVVDCTPSRTFCSDFRFKADEMNRLGTALSFR